MYIAYIEEIDGLTIITGVDKKQIDQIETEKAIKDLLYQSDEMKALQAKCEKINSFVSLNRNIAKSCKQIYFQVANEKNISYPADSDLSTQQKQNINNYNNQIAYNKLQITELQKDLSQINESIKAKKLQLISENAVYQETAYNQIDLTEAQYDDFKIKLISICQSNVKKYLVTDGNIIEDNRGKIVWIKNDKWKSRKIQFLTDVKDTLEIWEDELTDEQKVEITEQIEIDRLAALTEEEKTAEKEKIIESLLREAAIMKSGLEIQGDSDALQKSQDWYNTEVLKVEEKYS